MNAIFNIKDLSGKLNAASGCTSWYPAWIPSVNSTERPQISSEHIQQKCRCPFYEVTIIDAVESIDSALIVQTRPYSCPLRSMSLNWGAITWDKRQPLIKNFGLWGNIYGMVSPNHTMTCCRWSPAFSLCARNWTARRSTVKREWNP